MSHQDRLDASRDGIDLIIERKAMAKKRAAKRRVWTKASSLGKRMHSRQTKAKRIRQSPRRAVEAAGLRDLALFSVAIDTMLQGQNSSI